MAVLNDIREKSPKFIIAGAAIVFIVLIVFDWGLDLSGRRGRGGGKNEALGTINGKEVDYKYFSDLVRRSIDSQKKQDGEVSEESERQIRLQVWNQLVDEMLVGEEIQRMGIKVSDQEIRDIVMGPNPPEFLIQQFKDSTGTFRRDAYQRAMMDPQNKDILVQVEDVIRQDQKRRKLQSILLATVSVSEGEVKQRFIDRNVSLNADYILFDVDRFVPDSAVTVTDEDMREQYNSHAANFQVKPARKVKYISFSQNPSAEDSATVEVELKRLLEQAKSGASDFIELAKTYSDIPAEESFFKHGELGPKKENALFSAKKGEIVGPIIDNDAIHLIKILDERRDTADYIKVSHILLNVVQGPDSVKVIKKARELIAKARAGVDFAQLARENSQDYGSAAQGGEIGWGSKKRFVKPFADAAFRARAGDVVGPVRTQFGWHIIKVTGRDRRELKIIDLAMKVKPSTRTIEGAFQNALDFSYLAKEEGFEKAAENSKLEVTETPEFNKTGSIPGIGMNNAVMNFAFTNKVGETSEPFYGSNAVIVVKVSFIREEGLRPFDEVKKFVSSLALKEKKMEKVRDQVDAFFKTLTPSDNLLTAAQVNSKLFAQNTGPFKPTDVPAGVGRDLNFIGTALSLKQGELSKPVKGNRGYYIIKLLSKTDIDSARFNMERESLRAQLLQEKRQRMLTEWQTELREKADIVDNRYKYFR